MLYPESTLSGNYQEKRGIMLSSTPYSKMTGRYDILKNVWKGFIISDVSETAKYSDHGEISKPTLVSSRHVDTERQE